MRPTKQNKFKTSPFFCLNILMTSLIVLLQSCHSESGSQDKAFKQIPISNTAPIPPEDSLAEYEKTFFTNGRIRSACKKVPATNSSIKKSVYPKCIYYDSLGRIIKQKDSLMLITDLTKEGLLFNKILKIYGLDPYQTFYLQSKYPSLKTVSTENQNFYLSTDRKTNFIFFINNNLERKAYLIYKDSLFYEFPHHLRDEFSYSSEEIIGVSFKDINKDNLSDVIILKSGIRGYGEIDLRHEVHYSCNIFLKKMDNTGFIYDSIASTQLEELPTIKDIINKYKDVQKIPIQ